MKQCGFSVVPAYLPVAVRRKLGKAHCRYPAKEGGYCQMHQAERVLGALRRQIEKARAKVEALVREGERLEEMYKHTQQMT